VAPAVAALVQLAPEHLSQQQQGQMVLAAAAVAVTLTQTHLSQRMAVMVL
jgi:hypothetical protein